MSSDQKAIFTNPKSGYLYKKGTGAVYRPWSHRKFVLGIDFSLSYYGDENELKGKMILRGASVRTVSADLADGKEFAFEIYNLDTNINKSANLLMQAESQKDADDWIYHFQLCFDEDRESKIFRPSIALSNEIISGQNDSYLGN